MFFDKSFSFLQNFLKILKKTKTFPDHETYLVFDLNILLYFHKNVTLAVFKFIFQNSCNSKYLQVLFYFSLLVNQ